MFKVRGADVTVKVNGVDVLSVERVKWRPDDDNVSGAVVGRAYVRFPQGGEAHALVVLNRTGYVAIVWERTTKRFVAIPIPDGESRGI